MAKRSNNNSAGRRPHGDIPYDLNNSFVKKVATKMGDMIPQKSWLSKWFNSPGSNGNLFVNREGHGEQDIEEETSLQPPTKRPRIRMDETHPPGTFTIQPINRKQTHSNQQQDQDTGEFHDTLTSIAGPSSSHSFVASTPAVRNDIRIINNLVSSKPISIPQTKSNGAMINGNDGNSESGESTSGCSSLIPQMSHQDSSDNQNYINSPFITRKNIIDNKLNSFSNNLQSPRSLLLDSITRDSMSTRRPSFSISVMNNSSSSSNINNNSNKNNDHTSSTIDINTNRILSSPFYTGNTTFGGANAIERSRKNLASVPGVSQFQLKVPARSSVQVRPSNTSTTSDSSGMSQTAKRIFEALENFSSPISDAKKIPVKTIGNSSFAKKRTRDESFDLLSTTRVGLRHLTRELAVPTVPDMLKLKRRQKLQNTTLAARKIISANSGPPPSTSVSTLSSKTNNNSDINDYNKSYSLRTDDDDSSKFLGKLKAKTHTQKRTTINLEQQVEQVNLPNISLPITNLPKFDISLPKSSNSHNPILNKNTFNVDFSELPLTSRKSESFKISNTESSNNTSANFEFSSPIRLNNNNNNNNNVRKSLQPINDFTFSMPINAESQNNQSKNTANSEKNNDTPSMNFIWSSSSTAPKLKVTSDKLEKQNESCNKNVELKTGSCMDILSNKNQQQNEGNLWECGECFIKNNDNVDTCIACRVSKYKSSLNKKSSSLDNIIQSSTGNDNFKFNMANDNLNSNNNSKLTDEKTDDNTDIKNTPPTSISVEEKTIFGKGKIVDSVMDKLKPAIDSWECPGCMLRNPGNVITCPCCNASKPGLLKTTTDKPIFDTSLGTSITQQSSSFSGFGDKFKKPTGAWICDSCMVQNKSDVNECVACGGLKPGATPKIQQQTSLLSSSTSFSGFGDKFKKPTGAWTCDSCMVQNKSEVNECVACGGLKPGATPAIKSTISDSAPKFSFGIPAQLKTTETSTNKTESNGFIFGEPLSTSKTTTTKTTEPSFSFGIPSTTKSTDTSSGFTFAAPKKVDDFKNDNKIESSSTLKKTGFTFGNPTDVQKIQEVKEQPKENVDSITSISKTLITQSNTSSIVSTSSPLLLTSTNDKKTNEVLSFEQTPVSAVIKQNSLDGKTASTVESTEKSKNAIFTFGASSTQKISTASIFGEKATEPSKPQLISFSASATASLTPSTNTFGAKPNSDKLPLFGTISKVPTSGNNDNETIIFKAPTTAAAVTSITATPSTSGFGSGSAGASAATGGSSSWATFGTTSATTESPSVTTNIFGSTSTAKTPASTPGIFTFGSSSNTQTNKPTQSTIGFQFNAPPAVSNSFSTFGTSAPNSNSFSFGSNSTPSVTPAISNPSSFSFNAGGSNTTNTPTSNEQKTTSSSFNSFSNFCTTTPVNSATPAQPSNSSKPNATSAFNQSTVPNVFGNSQSPAISSFSSLTPANNTGFNFNTSNSATNTTTQPPSANTPLIGGFSFSASAAPSTGGFNFSTSAAPSTGGFNFNVPTPAQPVAFDPTSKPSFNFTKGSAPTTFMAPPQAAAPGTPIGQRKIKKAVRRMQPR